MGANDGLLILFMLNGAQTSNVDRVGEQLGTLIGLLDILRHDSKRIGVELLLKKESWWSEREEKYEVHVFVWSLVLWEELWGKGMWCGELMNLPWRFQA